VVLRGVDDPVVCQRQGTRRGRRSSALARAGSPGGSASRVDVRAGTPRAVVWAPDHGVHTLCEWRGGAGIHRTDLPSLDLMQKVKVIFNFNSLKMGGSWGITDQGENDPSSLWLNDLTPTPLAAIEFKFV
jgi:hypothetical protein